MSGVELDKSWRLKNPEKGIPMTKDSNAGAE